MASKGSKGSKGNREEPVSPHVGRCVDCAHGYVMSDGVKGNPLITECPISKTRYPQSWLCTINCFILRTTELVIHPMIYLNRKDPSPEEWRIFSSCLSYAINPAFPCGHPPLVSADSPCNYWQLSHLPAARVSDSNP